MRIIGCFTALHDMRLVALALVICLLGSLTTLQMLARAKVARGRSRSLWVAAGGVAFGCGVWVTHFVSMLAFRPHMPMAFNVELTLLSLGWAIGGGWLALSVGINAGLLAAACAGVGLGLAIGGMHFIGMAALQLPGLVSYRINDVLFAWLTALTFAPLAMMRFRRGRQYEATVFLTLSVVGLHFIAMAAVAITPNMAVVNGLATTSLAVAVAAVGLLILLTSLGGALLDQHLEGRAAGEAERFRRFTDATFEGLFFLDGDLVTDANLVICKMLGRSAADLIGAQFTSFLALPDHKVFEGLRAGDGGTGEFALLDAAGTKHVVDVLARPYGQGLHRKTVVAVRDAAERKKAERRIQELALTDSLTGLANRVKLREQLAQALALAERQNKSVAVLCLDLDRFKSVNDLMGHHVGDALLVEVARRLLTAVRTTDTVARLGGDEFIVVQAHGGQPEHAQALSERLILALSEPYIIEEWRPSITASIGISLYPADALTAEALLKKADIALYRAKGDGRNLRRFFEPDMDIKLRARRELEQELRTALENREFHLVYQPIFDSSNMQIVGYEALLRWTSATRGDVPPSRFIPVAEDCGLIIALGEWALDAACEEAASWHEPHLVAVNLSPAQFKSPKLTEQVSNSLMKSGLAAQRLELEVTEGVLIDDACRALEILLALKSQGIRIALDDFGTEYSSLSYLRRFPFDRLKIDRSFIKELGVERNAEAIVRCIITMSRSLQLDVTAEGVETEMQMNLLRQMQCGHLQGFLLGVPLPANRLAPTTGRLISVG